jgi:hypothetical protein
MKNRFFKYGLITLISIAVLTGLYNLPPVQNRLAWRLDELQAKIKYAISPPEKVVFVPSGKPTQYQTEPAVAPIVPVIATPEIDNSSPLHSPSSTPTSIPTAIPFKTRLTGFRHEYQGWNNCGPATLSMALSFWGWKGNQNDIAPIVKPNSRDKNVMPAELAGFVTSQTSFKVIVRTAGDVNLLKRLIAAGFPVIVEKGFESPKFDGWMGHYELITGYDNNAKNFIAQDSYMGPDLQIPAEILATYWRAFNFTYLLIYPMEREAEVAALLGPQTNEADNKQMAAQKAANETLTLKERDLYFAWFNLGSSLVALHDYKSASDAFDQAFALYPSIPQKSRPWRMLWYQTGPYEAYYYSERYQDVLNLANQTLNAMSEPVLEETYYWRALAKEEMGDKQGALDDLKNSLKYHPGFELGISELQRLNSATSTP